jgi:hypothetical protein
MQNLSAEISEINPATKMESGSGKQTKPLLDRF